MSGYRHKRPSQDNRYDSTIWYGSQTGPIYNVSSCVVVISIITNPYQFYNCLLKIFSPKTTDRHTDTGIVCHIIGTKTRKQ